MLCILSYWTLTTLYTDSLMNFKAEIQVRNRKKQEKLRFYEFLVQNQECHHNSFPLALESLFTTSGLHVLHFPATTGDICLCACHIGSHSFCLKYCPCRVTSFLNRFSISLPILHPGRGRQGTVGTMNMSYIKRFGPKTQIWTINMSQS